MPGHTRSSISMVTVLVLLLGLLTVGGCTEPRIDENVPLPDGRVLTGRVIESAGMEHTDQRGNNVDAPTMLEVETEAGSLVALCSISPLPSRGDWVEVSEGSNGRWFITAYSTAPETPVPNPDEEESATPVQDETTRNRAKVVALIGRVLKDAADLNTEWKGAYYAADRAEYLPQVQALYEDIKTARAELNTYRIWNTMITPEEELTFQVDQAFGYVETEAAAILMECDGRNLGTAGTGVLDPRTSSSCSKLREWREKIQQTYIRVDGV